MFPLAMSSHECEEEEDDDDDEEEDDDEEDDDEPEAGAEAGLRLATPSHFVECGRGRRCRVSPSRMTLCGWSNGSTQPSRRRSCLTSKSLPESGSARDVTRWRYTFATVIASPGSTTHRGSPSRTVTTLTRAGTAPRPEDAPRFLPIPGKFSTVPRGAPPCTAARIKGLPSGERGGQALSASSRGELFDATRSSPRRGAACGARAAIRATCL
jgi:hypothetical protein